MSNRRIFVVVLLVLTGAFLAFFIKSRQTKSFSKESQPVLQNLLQQGYDEVSVKTSNYEVRVSQDNNKLWFLSKSDADSQGFLADSSQIYRLFSSLGSIKFERVVGQGESLASDLGLTQDSLDESSTVIELYKQSKLEHSLFFGKLKATIDDAKPGQYLKLKDEDDIYLVNRAVLVPSDKSGFIASKLIDFDKDDLTKITLQDNFKKLELNKKLNTDDAGSDEVVWIINGDDKKIATKFKIKDLLDILAPVSFSSVKPVLDGLKKPYLNVTLEKDTGEKVAMSLHSEATQYYPDLPKGSLLIKLSFLDVSNDSLLFNKKNYYENKLLVVLQSIWEDVNLNDSYYVN